MKKKQHMESAHSRITNPRTGSAITRAKLTPGPPVEVGLMRSTVEDGNSDWLKILVGLIGNAKPVGVRKWQL